METANSILTPNNGLTRYAPRRFVPLDANLKSKEDVARLYETLYKKDIADASGLELWIWARSELEAALDETRSVLYIRMTCQTDHALYAAEHQDFIEQVVPVMREYEDRLNRRFLSLAGCFPLDAKRYHIYARDLKADQEIFSSFNIPLLTRLQVLAQDYQTMCGSWTVHFDKKEQTLVAMHKYLQEPSRTAREEAWRLTAGRRAMDAERLEELFDRMRQLRQQIAESAGCRDFIQYQFRAYHRFDYSPDDCEAYHAGVQKWVVPLWKKILERRRQQMQIDTLRPWDLAADPLGRPPLKPFETPEELLSKVAEIFHKLQPSWKAEFAALAQQGLLDLDNRKGKAPGGYQQTLNEARMPFIFMNAVGVDDDVRTLLHEGGHAFHSLACRHDPILAYRHSPLEFCEVVSMSMELIGGDYLEMFYDPEDKERSCQAHLEGVVHLLIWVAVVDAFQHWIYRNPKHTVTERRKRWRKILKDFGGDFVDWSGLESFEATLWHKQLHIFEVPFYYIEYGIAQLGALALGCQVRQNKPLVLQKLSQAMALGGARPLPELFRTAGIPFDFSERAVRPAVVFLEQELKLAA